MLQAEAREELIRRRRGPGINSFEVQVESCLVQKAVDEINECGVLPELVLRLFEIYKREVVEIHFENLKRLLDQKKIPYYPNMAHYLPIYLENQVKIAPEILNDRALNNKKERYLLGAKLKYFAKSFQKEGKEDLAQRYFKACNTLFSPKTEYDLQSFYDLLESSRVSLNT